MHFVMIADKPGWCFDRTAHGLEKFHGTEHTWSRLFADVSGHLLTPEGEKLDKPPPADLYRVGGMPLFIWMTKSGLVDYDRPRYVPTFASFWDLTEEVVSVLRGQLAAVAAIIVNDRRMTPQAMEFGVPVIYTPDRCDPDVFSVSPELAPKAGPLRVGWAGSVTYWKNVKHVPEIEKACGSSGVTFVRQDRDKEGWKTAAEMQQWFSSLDVLVNLNDELTCTPVTQIEAIACGKPVLTTRCGELWPHIEAIHPEWIIQDPSDAALATALKALGEHSREELAELGLDLRKRLLGQFISWECGEATMVTRAFEKLAEACNARTYGDDDADRSS